MNVRANLVLVGCLLTAASVTVRAQHGENAQAISSASESKQISLFSYGEGSKSDLYLRATPVGAPAEGTVRVQYKDGNAMISAKVDDLSAPASLGPYAVYVLWTLTPDGLATNQGVIAGFRGGRGKMDTEFQAPRFGLIVTAEPYFAVTRPSTMIVLYGVADDVKGRASKVMPLTEQADYSKLPRLPFDRPTSPEVVQARYAIATARQANAEQYAATAYAIAKGRLAEAETALEGKRKAIRRMAPGLARKAVVAAEGARAAARSHFEVEHRDNATAAGPADDRHVETVVSDGSLPAN